MDMFEDIPARVGEVDQSVRSPSWNWRTRFGPKSYRTTVHESPLVTIEDGYIPPEGPYPTGLEPRFQLGLTYFGAFSYEVGSRKWVIDANSSLFISSGWQSREKHLLPDTGHAAVILTPADLLLDEVAGRPSRSAAFAEGSVPASMRLRLLVQQILRFRQAADPLQKDEWTISAFREALATAPRHEKHRGSRVVDRAKEFLHAHFGERLFLQDIARAAGVTPAYLTQEFTRHEGAPLYRYQLRLRLSHALLELPHCEDITGLALDLGFSSHSHFTLSFGKAFGLTPSQYRAFARQNGNWDRPRMLCHRA